MKGFAPLTQILFSFLYAVLLFLSVQSGSLCAEENSPLLKAGFSDDFNTLPLDTISWYILEDDAGDGMSISEGRLIMTQPAEGKNLEDGIPNPPPNMLFQCKIN